MRDDVVVVVFYMHLQAQVEGRNKAGQADAPGHHSTISKQHRSSHASVGIYSKFSVFFFKLKSVGYASSSQK